MEGEALRTLYHKSFQELLIFMTESVIPKMDLLECNYIAQVCIILQLVFNFKFDFQSKNNIRNNEERKKKL